MVSSKLRSWLDLQEIGPATCEDPRIGILDQQTDSVVDAVINYVIDRA